MILFNPLLSWGFAAAQNGVEFLPNFIVLDLDMEPSFMVLMAAKT